MNQFQPSPLLWVSHKGQFSEIFAAQGENDTSGTSGKFTVGVVDSGGNFATGGAPWQGPFSHLYSIHSKSHILRWLNCTQVKTRLQTLSKHGQYTPRRYPYYRMRVCRILVPNSWMYNFVEVSGHNLESSQTWGFCMDFLNHMEGEGNGFLSGFPRFSFTVYSN